MTFFEGLRAGSLGHHFARPLDVTDTAEMLQIMQQKSIDVAWIRRSFLGCALLCKITVIKDGYKNI